MVSKLFSGTCQANVDDVTINGTTEDVVSSSKETSTTNESYLDDISDLSGATAEGKCSFS